MNTTPTMHTLTQPFQALRQTTRHARAAAVAFAIGVGVTGVLSGCGETTSANRTSSDMRATGGSTKELSDANTGSRVEPTGPSGFSMSSAIRSVFKNSISVPYDGRTLPIVSPNGRYVATQTGEAPSWPTVFAGPEAKVPWNTRIEIYDTQRDTIGYIAIVDEPALLGRSVTDEGFLIESQRDNGARWIGMAEWTTGIVNWLVKDDNVNAFASLGPNGQLAWSSRAIDDANFSLSVSNQNTLDPATEVEPWTLNALGTDWIMPTWSNRGAGLFVTTTRSGAMDITHGTAANSDAFRRSLVRQSIAAAGADIGTAYQSVNGIVGSPDHPFGSPDEHYVFLHLTKYAVGIWRPYATRRATLELLDRNTWHAVVDEWGNVISARTTLTPRRRDALYLSQLNSERRPIELKAGAVVPKPVTDDEWPWLLLDPNENVVDISFMRVENRDASFNASSSR